MRTRELGIDFDTLRIRIVGLSYERAYKMIWLRTLQEDVSYSPNRRSSYA